MNTLTITDLAKSYQTTPVLRGLTLSVPNGTFMAVLGASGSGKTTLLRIIAGFERAEAGRVRLGTQDLDGPGAFLPPERRGIGYVSQDGSLFPHLTVAGNVAFGLPRADRTGPRVSTLLEMVGLGGLGRRFPHQLSGGEQQRVALARALAPKPRLILLDEPFSALDAGLRASLRTDVKAVLRDAGVTAILVTHDQEEALSLADQIAVLRAGTIVQAGPPRDLYERPVDIALARFMGHSNFVQGVVTHGKVQTVFGALRLAPGPGTHEGAVVTVLVRPEQLKVLQAGEGSGPSMVVNHCEYYGHDAVMTVDSATPQGSPWTLRVPGSEAQPPGTRVELRFYGEALAWGGPKDALDPVSVEGSS